jgi:hypothetical protein
MLRNNEFVDARSIMRAAFVAVLASVVLVLVSCSASPSGMGTPPLDTYTISGTVFGLVGSGGGLVLQNDGGDHLSVGANGTFHFAGTVTSGSAYNVIVLTQPAEPTEQCSVVNGSGTATFNVTNVEVECADPTPPPPPPPPPAQYTISGIATGLASGSSGLILQDNGADNLSVNANGPFQFSTTITSGGSYNVTVLTQPTKPIEQCTVGGGSGNATTNVTTVTVKCAPAQMQLSFVNSSNPSAGGFPWAAAAADFNGDGKLDLAVVNGQRPTDITILLGNGDGTFTPGPTPSFSAVTAPGIAVGDFNGDGKADLAVPIGTNAIQVMLGNGDGTFNLMAPISVPQGVQLIESADFNGDGKLDLVVEADNITVLLGNGDGTFTIKTTISAYAYSVAVGDFNGDGIPDLAYVTAWDSVTGVGWMTVELGNGDGTFRTVAETAATGQDPTSMAVGDFNGDGILDVAVANLMSDTATVLLGNGDGTFTPTAVSPVIGFEPYSIRAADFNGDGKADLAVANAGSNTVSVVLGNGDGTFTTGLTPNAGNNPVFVVVGDFNGDGLPDLAVVDNSSTENYSLGYVTILLAQLTPESTADARRAHRR